MSDLEPVRRTEDADTEALMWILDSVAEALQKGQAPTVYITRPAAMAIARAVERLRVGG